MRSIEQMSPTKPSLLGAALIVLLVASCTTGPPKPRHLTKYADVDVLVPDVKRIRIVEVEVGSELDDMEDPERDHISAELRRMIKANLSQAGYEVVSFGEDAELSIVYSESRASPGDASRRRRVADVSLTVLDRTHKQVIYRGYSMHLPKNPPEGMFAFDEVKGLIEEHLGRVFGPGEWD